jgi:hypothetical protein
VSGGSYDYLFAKPVEIIMAGDLDDSLERMVDRLAGLGYAEDAAQETMVALLELRAARVRIATIQKRLAEVWKAVEWWDSGDSREDGVRGALAAYRGAVAGT